MDKDEIIELAHHAGIVFRLGSTDVTPDKLDRFLMFALEAIDERQRAYRRFGIWMRPEGAPVRRGINLTIIDGINPLGGRKGFIVILRTKKHKYRFRFRRGMKPYFLWSKE
jgi:hypothetical protein